ncbi:hypothetical protein CI109_106000 [Kwoniella shandongensis]|uniref:arginyltransferase n=1 Tax=Kwoniella shandongensis TaxID=1734106 RepID=A0A5M6BYB7_9TREE|nr:uncharacterized protein CI109_003952 [Kwoniella shandongensis]KAA5527693.1 hypothetical protein CI109_003952 [Kwoniella shandongensis]
MASTSLSPTLLTPYGYSSGSCGYCTPSGTRSVKKESSKYGMETDQMTPQYYQGLVDRGWRRSGNYVYHPDMARTCCPQYTIRLDALHFQANKKHKQVVNRFNRYLETGLKPGDTSPSPGGEPVASGSGSGGDKGGQQPSQKQNSGLKKGKGRANGSDKGGQRDVLRELHAFEVGYEDSGEAVHRFETQLVPAKATKETFELYKRYQISVHKDEPGECTMRGFGRFLCSTTLITTPIKYAEGVDTDKLPDKYGAWHLLYKIDGRLIGISVIDILPSCLSSVYFIWDPDYAWASLGKLSALYEVSLAKRIHDAGVDGMGWVYMGYWIPDCQKMRYKSEYSPSYLLDPGTNVFHPLSAKLENFLKLHPRGYFPFQEIELEVDKSSKTDISKRQSEERPSDDSDEEEDEDERPTKWPSPPPPSFADPKSFSEAEIDQLLVLINQDSLFQKGRTLHKISDLQFNNPTGVRKEIREFVAAVGKDYIASAKGSVAGKAILFFG